MSALGTLDAYIFFQRLFRRDAVVTRLTLLATLYWADPGRQG